MESLLIIDIFDEVANSPFHIREIESGKKVKEKGDGSLFFI